MCIMYGKYIPTVGIRSLVVASFINCIAFMCSLCVESVIMSTVRCYQAAVGMGYVPRTHIPFHILDVRFSEFPLCHLQPARIKRLIGLDLLAINFIGLLFFGCLIFRLFRFPGFIVTISRIKHIRGAQKHWRIKKKLRQASSLLP